MHDTKISTANLSTEASTQCKHILWVAARLRQTRDGLKHLVEQSFFFSGVNKSFKIANASSAIAIALCQRMIVVAVWCTIHCTSSNLSSERGWEWVRDGKTKSTLSMCELDQDGTESQLKWKINIDLHAKKNRVKLKSWLFSHPERKTIAIAEHPTQTRAHSLTHINTYITQ